MTWHVVYRYSSNSHSSSPPSSSNAFSLLSSEQDNPSTSGCRLVSPILSLSHCSVWIEMQHLLDASHCQSIPPSPYTLVATPSCSALHTGKLRFPECDSTDETLSFYWCSCIRLMYALCSSEQSAKAKTQKELFKTLKELKMHLPSEKRSKGKSSTINTLKYALRCVKQVKGKTRFDCHFFRAHS